MRTEEWVAETDYPRERESIGEIFISDWIDMEQRLADVSQADVSMK